VTKKPNRVTAAWLLGYSLELFSCNSGIPRDAQVRGCARMCAYRLCVPVCVSCACVRLCTPVGIRTHTHACP